MAFKFDLSQLPKNSYILKATLMLYSLAYNEKDTIQDDPSNPKWDKGPWGVLTTPRNNYKYLYPIEEDWNEEEASWSIVNAHEVYDFNTYTTIYAGKPYEYSNIDTTPPYAISFGGNIEREVWEEFDVKNHIQEIIKGERLNFGFFMSTLRTDSIYTYMFSTKYASSQYRDQSLRPKLIVEYDDKVEQSNVPLNNKPYYTFSNNTLKINHRNIFKNFSLSIYSIKGQIIFKKSFDHSKQSIYLKNEIEGLSGQYFICVRYSNNTTITIPIVVSN